MNVRVALVSPMRLLQVAPLFVLTCHWMVGVGVPLAATVNVAVEPAQVDTLEGCVVIDGPGVMRSTAGLDVAVPQLFVATARNWELFCEETTVKVSVELVSPIRLLQVIPPLVLTCH